MTAKEEKALVVLVVALANNPHIGSPWMAKDIETLQKWLLGQEKPRKNRESSSYHEMHRDTGR